MIGKDWEEDAFGPFQGTGMCMNSMRNLPVLLVTELGHLLSLLTSVSDTKAQVNNHVNICSCIRP